MENNIYYQGFSLPHETYYGDTTKRNHPNPYIQIGLWDKRGGVLGEFKLVWTDNGIQLQAYQDSWKIFCYMESLFNLMEVLGEKEETVDIHDFTDMLKMLGFTDTTEYNASIEKDAFEDEPVLGFKEDYYFLSNFYHVQVTYCGITYQNSEAAFQAQKCITNEECRRFARLSASDAKSLGRRVQLSPNWEDMKLKYMYDVCRAKFEQNPHIRQKLLDTNSRHLEECNNWGDCYWGTVNGKGENYLGKLLMKVRDELRNETK